MREIHKGIITENMGQIFVVMGKSATGKDTVYKRLIQDTGLALKTVVPYTTRPIRSGETDGVEYHFVTTEQWEAWKQAGKIIESRTYHTMLGDWHYFTAADGQIRLLEHDYILIGTLEAYEQIRAYFGKEAVVPVYIELEDGERLQRALNREKQQQKPRYDELCRRFLADLEDFSEENVIRCGIQKRYQNENLDRCVQEIREDIEERIVNKHKIML